MKFSVVAFVALSACGPTKEVDTSIDDAGAVEDTAVVVDTGYPLDTGSVVDTAHPTDAATLDTGGVTCASPGGPKCKAGQVCVPSVYVGYVSDYHCAPMDGGLGSGCLPACMGTSRCKDGLRCYHIAKTDADACGMSCDFDGDCGKKGICCLKGSEGQCRDGACVGGSCTRPGICAPC